MPEKFPAPLGLVLSGPAGFTLVEILVTVVLIALGCLAALWMQSVAMRGNSQSEHLTVASSLAESEIERLRSLNYEELGNAAEKGRVCELLVDRLGTAEPADCPLPEPCTPARTYCREVRYFKNQPTSFSHQVQVTVAWQDAHGPHKVVYTAALTRFNLNSD